MMTQENCYIAKGDYCGRYFLKYNINPGDKVLDIGGGCHPLPTATHVLDTDGEEYKKQRSGRDLFLYEHQTLINGTTDRLCEFSDNEFDYIYCSHVLEHVDNLPECLEEISRVGKRGFVAVPHGLFDFFQVVKDHKWFCDYYNNVLLLRKRLDTDSDVIGTKLWSQIVWNVNNLENTAFCKYWEGHEGTFGLRFLWEIRFFWEDKIDYKVDESIFPQVDIFRKRSY